MLLILKITPFDYESSQKNLVECLLKNQDVGFITNIIIFYPNNNIILPKLSKVKIVVKNISGFLYQNPRLIFHEAFLGKCFHLNG